jgi:Phosphate transporter family
MDYYLFILVILFGTAVAGLIVGVSNDAVNFLNSAVGSKAASRSTILIVASLGVLIGTTFSGGIMEVARKGIFNPEHFALHDVMIIFLAVMLTNAILLDLYNTFGLPTSTTVSIVFALLGGAEGIAIIKANEGSGPSSVFAYINTANVITIVSSIGLSIAVAFVFGSTVQFITRIIFTFNYKKTFRRYGALYCASAITAITYFILVKGAKGSTLLTEENARWMADHLWQILGASLLAWTLIWQALISFTRVGVLRIIVLFGTFALALAFAANDLVNFIGAPLGALAAYSIWILTPGSDPMTLSMEALADPVRANTLILLASGLVMAVTLWFSRKARSVTKTEVNLGRQEEGVERFESSTLARGIVRLSLAVFEFFKTLTPRSVQQKIAERIDPSKYVALRGSDGEAPSFDLIRAAVNLMVASALISFGTSLKLPLSTTFVTFMVAMSTSLADRSWGRESAVYRVNGVITVIGGWFFTAFVAFTTCFVLAMGIYYGGIIAILALVSLAVYFYLRTTQIHSRREAEFERREVERAMLLGDLDGSARVLREVVLFLGATRDSIEESYDGLIKNKRKQLKNVRNQATQIAQTGEEVVSDIFHLLKSSPDEDRGLVPRYAQKITALQIISANLNSLTANSFDHIDNNHHAPDKAQADELKEVGYRVGAILTRAIEALEQRRFDEVEPMAKSIQELKDTIKQYDKNQIKRIKGGKSGTRQSLLFIGTLSKAERIADQAVHLVKLYKESADEMRPRVPSESASY